MRSTLNDPNDATGPVVVATIRADNGEERARWRARAQQLGYTSLTAYITELIRLDCEIQLILLDAELPAPEEA